MEEPNRRRSMVGSREELRLFFSETKSVISLINTGGLLIGPHAKIIHEFLQRDAPEAEPRLIIHEYHIHADAVGFWNGRFSFLTNSRGTATVIKGKYSDYGIREGREGQLEAEERENLKREKLGQYSSCHSSSWRVIRNDAINMMNQIIEGQTVPFQYAGNMRLGSEGQGHNCVTWCLEKLRIANINIEELVSDSLKASPEKHATQGASSHPTIEAERVDSMCRIL